MGEDEGEQNAMGYGYAMADGLPFPEKQRFEGVASGMSEVEDFAKSAFFRVETGYLLFETDAFGHDSSETFHVGRLGEQTAVKRAGGDDGGLYNLAEAGYYFAFGEREEGLRGDQDGFGIAEGSDLVFKPVEVDAGLAADGGVDGGEDRCRNIHEADAPFESGGGESAEVADHSAS